MAPSNPVRLRFEAFELDEANARLLRNGQVAPLAPKPFALLCELVRRQGDLCTKQVLLDKVWGHQFVSDSVLKSAISDLRTVLGDDPKHPRFIETASRRGYRFVAPVTTIPATSPHVANAAIVSSPQASSFVGREAELTRLHRAWNLASSGKRSVVWVVGEPGIGKTALIEHFVASLGDVACARGQCVEYYGTGEPYLPVLEALAELCRVDSSVPDLLRAVAPAWLMQLPWLCTVDERDALRRELAGVGPERMLREIGEVLDRIADRRPLLLVTEDLHWSDRATIQLVDYIARRRGSSRLMWLASFRLAEVVALEHPLNSVRRELRLHSLCTEVVLDAFSETEVAACIATQSRSLAGDDGFVRALHERTDGVPLFIVSIVRDVLSQPEPDAQASRVGGVGSARQRGGHHRPLCGKTRGGPAPIAHCSGNLWSGVSRPDSGRRSWPRRGISRKHMRGTRAEAALARGCSPGDGQRSARSAVCVQPRSISPCLVRAHPTAGTRPTPRRRG